MPKILIRENDLTDAGASSKYNNYAVLITGFASKAAGDTNYAPAVRADSNKVYEFKSVGDFEATIGCVAPLMTKNSTKTFADGTTAIEPVQFYHYGNQMAYELLKMGYSVVYKSLGKIDSYDDFKSVLDAITDEASWEIFKDKASYDFRFISHGLLSSTELSKDDQALLSQTKLLLVDAKAAADAINDIIEEVKEEFASAAQTPAVANEELPEEPVEDEEGNTEGGEVEGDGTEGDGADGGDSEGDGSEGDGSEGDSSEGGETEEDDGSEDGEDEIKPDWTVEMAGRAQEKFRALKSRNLYQALKQYSTFIAATDEKTGINAYIATLEASETELENKTLTDGHINKVNGYIANLATYKTLETPSNKSRVGRGDCVALIELDESCYLKQSSDGLSPEDRIIEGIGAMGEINADNGTYCAMTVPSVVYKMGDTGVYNNKKFPGAFHYLACFMNSLGLGFAEWYAAAGYSRGVSNYAVDYTTVKLGEIAINALEPRYKVEAGDPEFACNVIANFRGSYYLWGNRTAHPLGTYGDNDGGDLVARSFLNIRQLCTTIKKQLFVSCRTFTFDPNSDALWVNFVNSIRPTLEAMKADQGIRDYKIVKVHTPTKATLKAKIRIIPIEAVEDFDIDVSLEDSFGETTVTTN